MPHCCNLVEKNIDIRGGIISKLIVFNNLINNKIDVKSRFKNYKWHKTFIEFSNILYLNMELSDIAKKKYLYLLQLIMSLEI